MQNLADTYNSENPILAVKPAHSAEERHPMNTYEFRPWREGDDLELLQVWGDPRSEQEAQQRASFGDASDAPFSRTLVVTDSGVPIAAGVVTASLLHPQRLWTYLEVAEGHRRAGLGTELLDRLREIAAENGQVPNVRVKLAPFSTGEEFAQAKGMKMIQRSRLIHIDAGAIPPVSLREDENGKPTQAIEDLATGSVELTSKLWEFYRDSHDWDVPAEVGLGTVNRYFLSDEARAFGALVLRDNIQQAEKEGKKGEIIAFAVSYHPFETDPAAALVDENTATEILLGYDMQNEGAVEAIMQLLSLLTAQYPVLVEVDDSMTALVEVTDVLLRAGTASVEGDPTYIYASDYPGAAS